MSDDFVSIGLLSQFNDGAPHKVSVGDTDVAVAVVEGEVYAINDLCTHSEVSLSEGDLSGCLLECWLHGSAFNLKTGEPLGPPATSPVATYAVRLGDQQDPEVFVSLTHSRGDQ